MSKLPLEGIRVIDMTVVFSGPFGTWLLAALGAEVIRVDSIHHHPDMARAFSMWPTKEMMEAGAKMPYPDGDPGEAPWNRHALFNRVGWNKRSCCINLDDPRGKDIFNCFIHLP